MEQISEQREIEASFTSIPPRNYFYLANGQIIKNIKELPNALENIPENIFSNHVNPYKNDFAKWVYDVYKKEKLSKLLGEIKSKEELIRVMRAYIRQQEISDEKISQTGYQDIRQKEDSAKNETISMRNAQEQTMMPSNSSSNNTNTNNSNFNNNYNFSNQQNAAAQILPKQPPLKINEINEAKPTRKIYVWKTADSIDIVLKPKAKPEIHKEEKKEEIKKEELKKEEPKPEIRKEVSPIIKKEETQKNQGMKIPEKLTSADEFFEKNPVLMTQAIDAKKRNMEIAPLDQVNYDEHKSKKETTDLFKDNYTKTYQRMSFMRKAGFDTSLIEMMVARVPAKIKMFEASEENRDAIVVKRYLNEAIEELNNLKH